jgi:hypothetical protein
MTEAVVLADGDHRDPGGCVLQKAVETLIRRAVMADLEHVHGAGVDRNRLRLGVAHQEHREVPPTRYHDEAELVRIPVALNDLPRWPECGEP